MDEMMTSVERVRTALSGKEPDRVPFFLPATLHGAKELGLSLKEYFSHEKNIVEGQLRLQSKYRHDCLSPFFYAAMEIEAWGGKVIFYDDGPPNASTPIITNYEQIKELQPPEIKDSVSLQKMLRTVEMLKDKAHGEVPVLGIVISPFSLPVMQMGFEKYMDLMFDHPQLFNRLMKVNEEFCINWGNAQLAAGAAAITYFDPLASPELVTREMYEKTGFEIAGRVINRLQGPAAIHLASGICLPVLDLISRTGAIGIGISVKEDPGKVKEACDNSLTVLGNLDGISMRHWSPEETEARVKEAIAGGGPGGGFILADNHGEIPFQVPDEVLMNISMAVHKWGKYPLNWL